MAAILRLRKLSAVEIDARTFGHDVGIAQGLDGCLAMGVSGAGTLGLFHPVILECWDESCGAWVPVPVVQS